MKNFPFQFLAPYSEKDKNHFFGRESEAAALAFQLEKHNVLLLYGVEGAGKTSLVACGLRNQIAQETALNLMISGKRNILESFVNALNQSLSKPYEKEALAEISIETLIIQLWKEQQKIIYVIFDQFEANLIAENTEELSVFFQKIAEVLPLVSNCKFLFILQETFLGKLSKYEVVLPALFLQRFYLASPNQNELSKIITQILYSEYFNSFFKVEDAEKIAQKISTKLENEREEGRLGSMQMCLYALFQKAQETAIAGELPILNADLVSKKTEIAQLFAAFLAEKIQIFKQKYPETSSELPLKILETLVSAQNFSIPQKDRNIHKQLLKNAEYSNSTITEVRAFLKEFSENGILNAFWSDSNSLSYEISHFYLREKVTENLALRAWELQKANEVYAHFLQGSEDEMLNLEEIALLESQEKTLAIPYNLKQRIKKTRKKNAEIEAKRLSEADKKLKFSRGIWQKTAVLAVIILLFLGWAVYLQQKGSAALLQAQVEEAQTKRVFSLLYFYKGRFALATKGDKYGFIDKKGNTRIEFEYDFALPFEEEIGLAKVKCRLNRADAASPLVDFLVDSLGTKYRYTTDIQALTPEITALDLRNQHLAEIPEIVFTQKQLKILLLNHNQLQNFSPKLAQLSSLEILNVNHNQISLLENLQNLKQLKSLEVAYNKVSKLSNLEGLEHLRVLNVSNNQILKLENLENLKSLYSLDVSNNRIRKKEGLENLKHLKEVEVYGNVLE